MGFCKDIELIPKPIPRHDMVGRPINVLSQIENMHLERVHVRRLVPPPVQRGVYPFPIEALAGVGTKELKQFPPHRRHGADGAVHDNGVTRFVEIPIA